MSEHALRGREAGAFVSLARAGRTSWKHFAGAGAVILVTWLVIGTVAFSGAMLLLPAGLDPRSPTGLSTSASGYVLQNVPFPFLLLGVLGAVRLIHRRPVRTLFTSYPRVRWGRILLSFAVYGALIALAASVGALIERRQFTFVFHPAEWIVTLPLILVLTTVQTTSEEVLFRGYLLQATGLLTRRTWVLVLLNATLFTLPHLANPEVRAHGPLVVVFYFCLGGFLTFITIRDGGLELALGAHAANNLFAALIVNQPNSSLPTRAIWQIQALDPLFALLSLLAGCAVFYLVLVRRGAGGSARPTASAAPGSGRSRTPRRTWR